MQHITILKTLISVEERTIFNFNKVSLKFEHSLGNRGLDDVFYSLGPKPPWEVFLEPKATLKLSPG